MHIRAMVDSRMLKIAAAMALNHPDVVRYVTEREEERERKRQSKSFGRPLAAAGLLAAGYGAKKLGDSVMSDEDRTILEEVANMKGKADFFRRTHGPDAMYKDTGQFYDYLDRAGLAARAKMFGRNVADLAHDVRNTDVMNKLTAHGAAKGDPKFDDGVHGSTEHYDAFKAGPISAMWHQITKLGINQDKDVKFAQGDLYGGGEAGLRAREAKEKAMALALKAQIEKDPTLVDKINAEVDKWNGERSVIPAGMGRLGKLQQIRLSQPGTPEFETSLLNHAHHKFQQDYINSPEKSVVNLTKKFDQYYREFLADKAKTMPGLTNNPLDFEAIKKLPHNDQMAAVREFPIWLRGRDPNFHADLDTVMRRQSGHQGGAAEAYAEFGRPMVHVLQDMPRMLGYGAMGLGAGLGAHWLYNKLRKPKSTRKPGAKPVEE